MKPIPPAQRRFPTGAQPGKPFLMRLKTDGQLARRWVQGMFLLLCLWIGVEFALFMRWGASQGQAAYVPHPPGAEGFLPISALLSLKFWLTTGEITAIHPAGLFIFVAILGIGLLLKKAFCSWLCPIGTLSEALWMLGAKALGRSLRVPRWLDHPLRALKYLLLAFFALATLRLDGPELAAFLASPFNVAADLRLYLFFLHLSGFALGVILVLALLSTVIQNFWCRYLCPYGALLGALSLLSPFRITRAKASCIDCGLCTKACPSRIQVHQAGRVASDECTACFRCVEACPVKDTLEMRGPVGKAVPGWVFGLLVVGLFVAVTGMAILTGHWCNQVSRQDYLEVVQALSAR
ncbi:MAG TPA: 4Fe-4S binding protein [Geothrix sp.]|nr:4Fe-4S binding protein [Geothrix sp.]